MTSDAEAMTLDIAHRVLNDERSDDDRKAWAEDAILAIEFGDVAAAVRIGMLTPNYVEAEV